MDKVKPNKLSLSSEDEETPTIIQKQPLRKLEFALHRITKVAIPLHVDLINKHKENIERFCEQHFWERVHTEQVNASRIVQQLKADIYELESFGQHIREEDFSAYECQAKDAKIQALMAIKSFIEIHSEVMQPLIPLHSSPTCSTSSPPSLSPNQINSKRSPTPPLVSLPSEWLSEDLHLHSSTSDLPLKEVCFEQDKCPPQNSQAAKSWNNLKGDLLDLNYMINNFSSVVKEQQTHTDAIQDNLTTTKNNVQCGVKQVGMAVALKAAVLPVAGAVIGGALLGPVGLLAGYKIAGLACAVGGGLLGYGAGSHIKKKKLKAKDIELQNLSRRNLKGSVSLPDITADDASQKNS